MDPFVIFFSKLAKHCSQPEKAYDIREQLKCFGDLLFHQKNLYVYFTNKSFVFSVQTVSNAKLMLQLFF